VSTAPRILAFAGSTRRDSFNKKLARIAAEGARRAGVETTVIDLRDFPMPLFDEDLEAAEGMPEAARQFKQLLLDHQGLLIAAAEYNSGVTAVLKNAIDWASRKGPDHLAAWPFSGKVAGILCASPGALGGIRVLPMLRMILSNIDIHVVPDQVAIPAAHDAFAADGTLKDPKKHAAAQAVGAKVAHLVTRLHAVALG
jgi:NAD(P)H-dependent FMN reductase